MSVSFLGESAIRSTLKVAAFCQQSLGWVSIACTGLCRANAGFKRAVYQAPGRDFLCAG